MECRSNNLMFCFGLVLTFHSYLMILSSSRSIIKTLPGYAGVLPFKLETGYVGVGEKEDVQLFYYFVESTRYPEKDPLIFYIPGGPGASALLVFLDQIGAPDLELDVDLDNETLKLKPSAWAHMANFIYMDIPAGSGFSYGETQNGWLSGDTIVANQANEFIKKFLLDHPKFLGNPLYIAGISYMGVVIPKITLELYEGNERGDQPTLNIQGYILISPLTNKFKDFNSRFEYAHRMALISDDIYKFALQNCHGNYVDSDTANSLCAYSLHQYEQCTSHINLNHILEPFCDKNDPMLDCKDDFQKVVDIWANIQDVQQALNVRQEKIGRFELFNNTLHYYQGKNDTFLYSYDIFSSFSYHEKLSKKNCQLLIISGDHDMTFPYVGVEQWISSLNLHVKVPWNPFSVNGQIGGYEMKYAQNNYALTYAIVKGGGHWVPYNKPNETFLLMERWFSSQIYSSDS